MNNTEYCRNWHAQNRERSRQLAKEYYARQTQPIKPQKSLQEVQSVLRNHPLNMLNNKPYLEWSTRDWKKFNKLTDEASDGPETFHNRS